jgi:hypothetical protein
MLHVGMNIADKKTLMKELFRALKPGAVFGIYDVMRTGEGELVFPVPWASEGDGSAVASPTEYRSALEEAGFAIEHERNRSDFALKFFSTLQTSAAAVGGPPPLGLQVLMGSNAGAKVANLSQNVSAGCVAPIELIAVKPAS